MRSKTDDDQLLENRYVKISMIAKSWKQSPVV